jgi:hypothetical protein
MAKEKKNTIKKNTIRKHKKQRKTLNVANLLPKVKMPKALSEGVLSMLDGSFLTRDYFLRQAPVFFYLLGLAFLYIAINFYADKTLLNIERTKEDIKELRFEYLTVTSELIRFTQASNVKSLLEEEGIKRPVSPPAKIIVSAKKGNK